MSDQQPALDGFAGTRRPHRPRTSTRRRDRTFPLEPFARALGIQLLPHGSSLTGLNDGSSDRGCAALAAKLGDLADQRTVERWRAEGIPRWRHTVDERGHRVKLDFPDLLACTIAGMHPLAIWPDWLDDVDDDAPDDLWTDT